jgi:hypothetical protein
VTEFAGPLLPLTVVTPSGRLATNREVTIIYGATRLPAPIYLDRERTPAPLPLVTDAYGNLSGYFAEPGFYIATAGDLPEVTTMATLDPHEAAAGVPGPQGAPGPQGTAAPRRFEGHGPPGTIFGAGPKDEYLDVDTGNLYVNN